MSIATKTRLRNRLDAKQRSETQKTVIKVGNNHKIIQTHAFLHQTKQGKDFLTIEFFNNIGHFRSVNVLN